jgi:hypothetical protein
LLHSTPLDAGRVRLQIPSSSGREFEVSADVSWCASIGEGWYVSGGRFVRLLLEQAPDRLM